MKMLIVQFAQWLIYKLSDSSYKGPTFTVYRVGDSRAKLQPTNDFTKSLALDAGKAIKDPAEAQQAMLRELLHSYGVPRKTTACILVPESKRLTS